jgi:hypothetical protein
VVVMATSLRVPAGGEASKVIPGPRPGHYPVKVDGVAAGLLVTGVNPGPYAASSDAGSRRGLAIRAEQHDAEALIEGADDQHLGLEWPDPPRREDHHAHHERALELLAAVVGDLGR